MTGKQLRDEGIAKVDANTDVCWKEQADEIIGWLAKSKMEFTAEDVRELIPNPPSPNSMGARFISAIKSGIIKNIKYVKAKRPSAHARVIAVYQGTN